jgi:hypothetical protein
LLDYRIVIGKCSNLYCQDILYVYIGYHLTILKQRQCHIECLEG